MIRIRFGSNLEDEAMSPKHLCDFSERAVGLLVIVIRSDYDTEWSAIWQVATRLGVGPETLRKSVEATTLPPTNPHPLRFKIEARSTLHRKQL